MACKQPVTHFERKQIAKVFDNILYFDDIEEFVPAGITTDDSTQLVSGLVNKWIMRQLKLHQAEKNLSLTQKDITKEIEEYRSSLLIYKYEQEYINQKLDTVMSNDNLKSYYNGSKPELLLDKAVVKCAYVILPADAPQYYTFRNRFRSHFDKRQEEINEYTQKYARVYYHNDEFLYFDELAKHVPVDTDNIENMLKYNSFIEIKDDDFKYLITIFDYKLKGELAPLNIVKNEIRRILLNKRKIQLIRNLEENIFNDAMSHKNIEIRN